MKYINSFARPLFKDLACEFCHPISPRWWVTDENGAAKVTDSRGGVYYFPCCRCFFYGLQTFHWWGASWDLDAMEVFVRTFQRQVDTWQKHQKSCGYCSQTEMLFKSWVGTNYCSFARVSFLSKHMTQGLILQVSHAAQEVGLLSTSFSQSTLCRIIYICEALIHYKWKV